MLGTHLILLCCPTIYLIAHGLHLLLFARAALNRDESDRAVRIARILALAEGVFGDHEKALRWLRKPKRRFENRSPLELLVTDVGSRAVEELLYQIDYGMAA